MTPETREELARAIRTHFANDMTMQPVLNALAPIIERLVAERVAAETERCAGAERYAAAVLHDLSEAKREISTLRDAVVTYGDRVRMAMAASPAMQQAIDHAFDRDNSA